MKKVIKTVTIVVLAISFLLIASFGALIVYARNNIDYDFDEELFNNAKDDKTVYYYAYDSDKKLIEVFKSTESSKSEWTRFADIGENIKHGFIAMEDRDYYKHSGVNVRRTLAAAINHIFKIGDSFGASTITQQVIKNVSGNNETSISRKIKEILRAINIERNHSKDDIFELYLNIVPMSGNIHGVGAASEIYFGKEPQDLSLAEAATIVGITNAPAKYNPYTKREACIEKRNKVLYAMLDVGFIDREEYESAIKTPLILSEGTGNFGISSWFVETACDDILKDISSKYGVSRAAARLMMSGCRVILTMNPEVQRILDEYFRNTDNLSEKVKDGLNYSMVISDPNSGDLLGIIGNAGKKDGERLFNYATSPVTPGSVLKPIALYAPLIDQGKICWSTMIDDSPVEYHGSDENLIPYPKNSPDVYEGAIDVNNALQKSKNTVAVRLFGELGADNIFSHLMNTYGFDTLVEGVKGANGEIVSDKAVAPLALGQLSYGVSLRKLTEAYNVFPSYGILYSGRSYISVYDRNGESIVTKETSKTRIYSEETTQVMNQLLSNVVLDGTAKQIRLKELIDVAGKTGTSGSDKDRLFIGYTPYYTAGIWCGFGRSDRQVGFNSPNHLQIWDEVMTLIHDKLVFSGYDESLDSFKTNKTIVAPYCSKSGMRPCEDCELDEECEIRFGYFTADCLPDKKCDYH